MFRMEVYRPRFEVVVDAAKSRSVGVTRIGVTDVPKADSTSRGVAAGRSAERGTSAATTGPRGAAGPHNPDEALPPLPGNRQGLSGARPPRSSGSLRSR